MLMFPHFGQEILGQFKVVYKLKDYITEKKLL